jgi:hypothetical protein
MGRWTESFAIQGLPRDDLLGWQHSSHRASRETKSRPAALGTSGASWPATVTYGPLWCVERGGGRSYFERGYCRSGRDGASVRFGPCVLCLLAMEFRTEPRTGTGLFFLINGLSRYWSINELKDPQKAKLGRCSFGGTGHEFHVKHTAACPGG